LATGMQIMLLKRRLILIVVILSLAVLELFAFTLMTSYLSNRRHPS